MEMYTDWFEVHFITTTEFRTTCLMLRDTFRALLSLSRSNPAQFSVSGIEWKLHTVVCASDGWILSPPVCYDRSRKCCNNADCLIGNSYGFRRYDPLSGLWWAWGSVYGSELPFCGHRMVCRILARTPSRNPVNFSTPPKNGPLACKHFPTCWHDTQSLCTSRAIFQAVPQTPDDYNRYRWYRKVTF